MTSLHIHKLHARYHLSNQMRDQKQRLDSLLDRCTSQALEMALEDVGIREQDEVAIRNIYVPVTLKLGVTDNMLIDLWSSEFANIIKHATEQKDHSKVVWYPSRLRAMLDFAKQVALANANSNWVWRQLGFASVEDNAPVSVMHDALIEALASEQVYIMPVLAYLSRSGHIQRLIGNHSDRLWMALVHMAAAQAGMELSAINYENSDFSGHRQMSARPSFSMDVDKLLNASHLSPVFESKWSYLQNKPDAYRCMIFLLLILSEPNIMVRSGEVISREVMQVAARLRSRFGQEFTGYEIPEESSSQTGTEKTAYQQTVQQELEDGNLCKDTAIADQKQRAIKTVAVEDYRNGNEPYEMADIRSSGEDIDKSGMSEDNLDNLFEHDQKCLYSQYGGLLFLIPILRDLALYQEIAKNKLIEHRPTGWVLQHIVDNLIFIERDDPALRVFCGCEPVEKPYWEEMPPPSDIEMALLKRWCREITDMLRRVSGWTTSSDKELLEKLCLRKTRLFIEPGWVDVYFDSQAVNIDIRRAGLDLDPGYEPGLGYVIKFHYE